MKNGIRSQEHMFIQGSDNTGNGGAAEKSKKLKKNILFIFGGMIAFILLFYILSSVFDFDALLNKISGNTYNPTKQTIVFATPDYNEDIYKDSGYMSLDRNIYIYDVDTGMTESLEEEDFENYSDGVRFLSEFVRFIIDGDAESYNECFTDECFFNDSVEYKEAFTMQKLYEIKITRLSENEVTDSPNGNYTKYEYILEYMIRHNNGTFRTDIGSDASKKQYITLTDRTGKLLIEAISSPVTK